MNSDGDRVAISNEEVIQTQVMFESMNILSGVG